MSQDLPECLDKITKEIRFAVVMYGGVSLAIYMNGIAQEFLNMVTATSNSGRDVRSTSCIYKEIADHLERDHNANFKHRFVVDIISGTSAGGINGMCLAKGLALGINDLKVLEGTWLKEGNIDTLLNDRQSEPNMYCSKEPKTSLLNSQRMYAKLLDAFKKMETNAEVSGKNKAYVETLDLFVTVTDLRGLQLPIQLSDGTAMERIHKHVFPFSFRNNDTKTCKNRNHTDGHLNHFDGTHNPMLAFAARCTSSFPTAFEPVKLNDVLHYLESRKPDDYQIFNSNLEKWKDVFFSGYGEPRDGFALEQREFADGGYLDNRPFGHTIEAIHTRKANCPLERKLFFIDPSPETDEKDQAEKQGKEISFLKNTALAAFSLPGYETIREEINDLKQHNAWIRKVASVLQKVGTHNTQQLKKVIGEDFQKFAKKEKVILSNEEVEGNLFSVLSDLPTNKFGKPEKKQEIFINFWDQIASCSDKKNITEKEEDIISAIRYEHKDVQDMIQTFGDGYVPYHFSKVELLTEQLARLLAKACRINERQTLYRTISSIIEIWRKEHFTAFREEGKETENIFFRNYDIDFRIRRLNFFRQKVEEAFETKDIFVLFFGLHDKNSEERFPEWNSMLETSLTAFYHTVGECLGNLYRLKEDLMRPEPYNPLSTKARFLKDALETISPNNSTDKETLKKLGLQFEKQFHKLMQHLNHLMKDGFSGKTGSKEVSSKMYEALDRLGKASPVLSACMKYVYRYGYDLQDSTSFQLMAGGEYGEGTEIGIYRISPADAVNLWDERKKTDEKGRKLRKLAGISMGAFGGFLDKEWRRNDILWGRLDAAERIISALLPGKDHIEKRKELIDKAHHTILREAIPEWTAELKSSRFKQFRDETQHLRLIEIERHLDSEQWKEEFRKTYDFNRDMEPKPNLERLGRTSGILSSMIDRLDPGEGITKKISSYLKKLNWILLGLLDFSTPKTFKGILFSYWMHLLMLVSLVIIAGSFYMNENAEAFRKFGLALLSLNIIVLLFKHLLTTNVHKITCRRSIRRLASVIISFLVIGLLFLLTVIYDTVLNHGGEFLSEFGRAFDASLEKMTNAVKNFVDKLFGGG